MQANHRAHVQRLEDQIVLLKVEPRQAAAKAQVPDKLEGVYIPPFDDDALSEYEAEQIKIRLADG